MAETATARDHVPEALRSHHVRPDEMPWRTTAFDGVEMKPLYVNRETGLLTVLMRMAPGSVLPDHEHVQVEQTYVSYQTRKNRHFSRLLSNAKHESRDCRR